jgi:hypothetical protein
MLCVSLPKLSLLKDGNYEVMFYREHMDMSVSPENSIAPHDSFMAMMSSIISAQAASTSCDCKRE